MTYCSTLTDAQLRHVLKVEHDRNRRTEDDDLYTEAREECLRRGIEPDEELNR